MPFTFKCPKCRKSITVLGRQIGETDRCSAETCGHYFRVPDPSTNLDANTWGVVTIHRPRYYPEEFWWAIAALVGGITLLIFLQHNSTAQPEHLAGREANLADTVMGLVMLTSLLYLIGFVAACLGYKWGAYMSAIAFGCGVVFSIPAYLEFGIDRMEIIRLTADGIPAILFFQDEPQRYYDQCEDYRMLKRRVRQR